MAIQTKHHFVSAKGDGSDATLVRPSDWNASHDITLATNNIMGRLSAGPGAVEELPVTSYMIGLLNSADANALALALGLPMTGDAMLTYTTTARQGWIFANDGSIGDVGSGSTTAAANTVNLFTLFYNTFSDAVCPLQTSAGSGTTRAAQGAAATAFTAKCRMVIPKNLGRSILIAGSGAGLTARGLAGIGGEEAHQLLPAEVPDHVHAQTGTFGGTYGGSISGSGSGSCSGTTNPADRDLNHLHTLGGATASMNRSNPHNHSGTTSGATNVSTSGGGQFFIGLASTQNLSINNTDINHEHGLPGNTGATDRSIDHLHTFNGGASVSVGGSCSVSVSITLSGNTGGAGFGWGYHNNMQPWTAWNIMIRL
jgi:hypothetical protein